MVAVFLSLALWGLGRDPVAEGTGASLPLPPDLSDVAGESSPAPKERHELPAEEPLLTSGWVSPPRDITSLLDARFKVRGEDAAFQSLRLALAGPRSVAVVNLWATYCPPCRNEFPGFKALQTGWGDQVRFVPIQLGEDEPGDLVAAMPESPHSLVDTTSAGVVQSVLVKSGLLPPNPPIPITLLLDCKGRLRWIRIGEVKDTTPSVSLLVLNGRRRDSTPTNMATGSKGLGVRPTTIMTIQQRWNTPFSRKMAPRRLILHPNGWRLFRYSKGLCFKRSTQTQSSGRAVLASRQNGPARHSTRGCSALNFLWLSMITSARQKQNELGE